MLRAVLFDLDGTLIDSTDAIVESTQHTFVAVGRRAPTREEVIATIGFPMREGFGMLGVRPEDLEDIRKIYAARYAEHAPAKTVLLPGVRESLDALAAAGMRMGVVTSKRREAALQLIEYLGVLERFELCIGPEDVVKTKPDAEGLLLAMARMNTSKDETVYVGDMDFDVYAAAGAGITCLAVATGYCTRTQLESFGPHAVFDSMKDICAYVLKQVPPVTCAP